jgi:hypothetical protein
MIGHLLDRDFCPCGELKTMAEAELPNAGRTAA